MRLRTADIYGGMIPSRLREDETLPALAQSIARHGLLQPIVVQENPANGRYMLVCGARRLAACRMLGLEEIDAVNIPGDKPEAVACFLEEHFTRKRVSFLEEARLLSGDGVAQKCCMPEGEMRRRLSMLELDAQTQAVIECGRPFHGAGRMAQEGAARGEAAGGGGDHRPARADDRAGAAAA